MTNALPMILVLLAGASAAGVVIVAAMNAGRGRLEATSGLQRAGAKVAAVTSPKIAINDPLSRAPY